MTDQVTAMLPVTPAEPPNGKYEFVERDLTGKQLTASYDNGYGASVIQGPYSYGGSAGKFELAVLHGGPLCYATPITDDVIGWLDEEEVVIKLHEIARLPRNDACTHEGTET